MGLESVETLDHHRLAGQVRRKQRHRETVGGLHHPPVLQDSGRPDGTSRAARRAVRRCGRRTTPPATPLSTSRTDDEQPRPRLVQPWRRRRRSRCRTVRGTAPRATRPPPSHRPTTPPTCHPGRGPNRHPCQHSVAVAAEDEPNPCSECTAGRPSRRCRSGRSRSIRTRSVDRRSTRRVRRSSIEPEPEDVSSI